jgi:hypothetical protein
MNSTCHPIRVTAPGGLVHDTANTLIKVTLVADGKISMPLIGEISASGKTPEQLKAEVTDALVESLPEAAPAWQRVAAHEAGEAADALRHDRVPLVRHGGRAFLFFAEELFGLAHFSALQVANLGCDLVQG